MRSTVRLLWVMIVLFCGSLLWPAVAAEQPADPSLIEQGKTIAFDRRKGNCLSCHMIQNGELPGNAGPPLVVMKARFPNKADLRAQIWDPMVRNPQTIMPPFGRHGILSEDEIDKIVEFVYSL